MISANKIKIMAFRRKFPVQTKIVTYNQWTEQYHIFLLRL